MKTMEIETNIVRRKSGRPRAISDELVPLVLSLYQSGLGYRSISNELRNQGIFADWSTVRRVIKNYRSQKDHQSSLHPNSDTILTRDLSEDEGNPSQTTGSGAKRWRHI